jgi:flavin reductase (DIM6/NTAB) family NADH-FMN oxidoreductase RutF
MTFTDREFRDALGQFPTGVCIVTAEVDGRCSARRSVHSTQFRSSPLFVLFSLARSALAFSLWL